MSVAEFRSVKSEIRVIGFDDGSFEPHSGGNVPLVGVVLRGGEWVEGILVDEIEIDGTDSTSTMVDMINNSKHKEQLRIILSSGITFGGFNVLDVEELYEKTELPVIVVSREKPDMPSVKSALKNLPDWEDRWETLKSAGDLIPVETESMKDRENTIYTQIKGIKEEDAREVVKMISTRSSVPEPLRVAHLIATGITRGESVGRA